MVRIEGLKPIINEKSTVLILGSMPSKISIEQGQYYANPKNQFWKIIKEILGVNSEIPHRRRKDILLAHGFALWDVLKSCERSGSLDKNIRNPIGNDLEAFLRKYKQIDKIGFNGQESMKLAKKLKINLLSRSLVVLPSSSTADTSSLAEKIVKWKSFLS